MSFGSGLEQSSILIDRPEYLIHEYTRVMLLGLMFARTECITLLGLGGGGLLHCIHHYFPEINIQAIEYRRAVIDVAHQWFDLPVAANIHITCSEACEYLKKLPTGTTGLILSDLYEASGMSKVQAQQEFIEAAENALSEQGWLLLNFHQLPEKNSVLMLQIQAVFSDVYVCDVFSGNWVVFCGRYSLALNQAELTARARQLATTVEMPMVYYFKQLRAL